ncbi:hypothetical protein HanIR_Chr10g0489621 [Helianthus annuus]|nr:hypothetical protein HanIR_Chr10g0489621 [Helianthus annuus]
MIPSLLVLLETHFKDSTRQRLGFRGKTLREKRLVSDSVFRFLEPASVIRVAQSVFFFKTSSGYGQEGKEWGIAITGVGLEPGFKKKVMGVTVPGFDQFGSSITET